MAFILNADYTRWFSFDSSPGDGWKWYNTHACTARIQQRNDDDEDDDMNRKQEDDDGRPGCSLFRLN
jgi:hypothetical protein